MKHPNLCILLVMAAALAASGCTYDNLDKLNQTTDEGNPELCAVDDCLKPVNVNVKVNVSGNKGNCECTYDCSVGIKRNGTENENLECVECNNNDECSGKDSTKPFCDSNGKCVESNECEECIEPTNEHVEWSQDPNDCSCSYSCISGFIAQDGSTSPSNDPNLVCVEDRCDVQHCKEHDGQVGYKVEHVTGKLSEGCTCSYMCDELNGYRDQNAGTGELNCVFDSNACDADDCNKYNGENGYIIKSVSGNKDNCVCVYACAEKTDSVEYVDSVDSDGNLTCSPHCLNNTYCFENDAENPYCDTDSGSCISCANACLSKITEDNKGVVVESSNWDDDSNNCSCLYKCDANSGYHRVENSQDEGESESDIKKITCGICDPRINGNTPCGSGQYCCIEAAWRCNYGACYDKQALDKECYDNSQCNSEYCDTENKKCIEDPSCETEACCQEKLNQHWSSEIATCVACVEDSHCAEGTPHCSNKNICVECVEDNHCGETTPYCSNTNTCVTKKGNGDTCQFAKECSSGICKDSKCASECSNSDNCLDGFYCDGNKKCAQKLLGGEACGSDNNACQSGSCKNGLCTCSNDVKCKDDSSYYCASSTCTLKKLGGETCSLASQCQTNMCSGQICSCSNTVGCKVSAYVCDSGVCVECKDDSKCSSPTPYCSDNKCVAKRQDGDACSGHVECNSGYCNNVCTICNNDTCCNAINSNTPYWSTTNEKCVAIKENGDACSNASECSSGHCDDKCVACTEHNHCSSSEYCCVNSSWNCERDTCNPKKLGGEKVEHAQQCLSNYAPNDYICRCEYKNNVLSAPCVEGKICNCFGRNCTGSCIDKGTVELNQDCRDDQACKIGLKCTDNKCSCINGAYNFDEAENVVQQCRNDAYETVELSYYNYFIACSGTDGFTLKYNSQAGVGQGTDYSTESTTEWCDYISSYLNGTLLSDLDLVQRGYVEDGPKCYVNGDKAFELYIYSSADLHLTSCERGCNTNFTLCHQDVMYSSYCDLDVLNMTYYVNNGYNEWRDDLVSISNSYVYGQGNLCYFGILLFLQECELRKPDTSDSFSGVCKFYELSRAHEVASSYSVCIDFYNKETYEKRSFVFGLTGDSSTIPANGTLCPNGCNSNYSGCK